MLAIKCKAIDDDIMVVCFVCITILWILYRGSCDYIVVIDIRRHVV